MRILFKKSSNILRKKNKKKFKGLCVEVNILRVSEYRRQFLKKKKRGREREGKERERGKGGEGTEVGKDEI